MYHVYVKQRDGEFLLVASREELEEATALVQEFSSHYPHEYVIRDSEGKDVAP